MKVLSLVKGWAHGGRECFAGPCPSDKETFPPGPGYDVTKSSAIPPPFRSPSQPFRGHSAATRPDSSAYDGPMATWRQAPAGDFGRVRAPSPSDVSGRSRDQEKSEIPLDVSWEGEWFKVCSNGMRNVETSDDSRRGT